MDLTQIVYVSSAKWDISNRELLDILAVSRENNSSHGITGFLMYANQSFMQVIEGEEAALTRLYSLLLTDERHDRLTKLRHQKVSGRLFEHWSMAFRLLDDPELVPVEGFSRLLEDINQPPMKLPDDGEVETMIEAFKLSCNRWR